MTKSICEEINFGLQLIHFFRLLVDQTETTFELKTKIYILLWENSDQKLLSPIDRKVELV